MKDERINEMFARIGELEIELDPDPISRGPKYLNGLVACCRNYTNEVQVFMLEVSLERRLQSRRLHQKKTDFDMVYSDLMANDADIKRLLSHSRADREALANHKLQEDIIEIQDLEGEVNDLKHVESVLKAKLDELKAINRDIRLQKQIIHDEIETGSFWGNDHGEYQAPHDGPEKADLSAPEVADAVPMPEPEPDYEDLFSDADAEGFVEEQADSEFGDIDLDLSDLDAKVSPPEKKRDPVGKPTGIFSPQEEDDIDFESALNSMG